MQFAAIWGFVNLDKNSIFIGAGVQEVKGNGGGGSFHPFKKERGAASDGTAATPASTSSTAEDGAGNKKEQKEGQSQRKTRRCWSPELHRRFLQSLQQLGGSHGIFSIVFLYMRL